jgi:plastocyanin
MKPVVRGIVACAALVAVLAACGGSEDEGTPYKEPAGPAVATLRVKSGNVFFDPTELDAPKGIVRITLRNIESGTHDLVIRGLPGFMLDVSGEGSTASGKVNLTKKQYEFYCTIPGHEEAGMKGTITVS